MGLTEIDLSDIEGFWTRPMQDRYAAFATLRREDPIRFYEEPEIEGIEVAAVCSHEGQRYSEGAVACMAGQRMSCDPSGRWVAGGDC